MNEGVPKPRRRAVQIGLILVAIALVIAQRSWDNDGPGRGSGAPKSPAPPKPVARPVILVDSSAKTERLEETDASRTLIWRVTVANVGKAPASRTQLDLGGPGLRGIAMTDPAVSPGSSPDSWLVGTLGAGQTRTFTVRATAEQGSSGEVWLTSWVTTPDVSGSPRFRDALTVPTDLICQVNGSVTEDLDLCDMSTVPIDGGPSIGLRATPTVAGGGFKATARVESSAGAPVAQAPVTFHYPGHPDVKTRTRKNGVATGWLTARAGTSVVTATAPLRSRKVSGTGPITARAIASVGTSTPTFSGSDQPLLYRTGAYGVYTPKEVAAAAASGVSMFMTASSSAALRRAARAAGTNVVDGRLKALLYGTLCAGTVCHAPTDTDLQSIAEEARAIVQSVLSDGSETVGWYLTDDNFGVSFRPALAVIRRALLDAGDTKPTVCAFGLNLVPMGDPEAARHELSSFQARIVNYDPSWCDSVTIYSYPPTSSKKDSLTTSWDWSMEHVLPGALTELRSAGWNPATEPLIGAPAGFGWAPRRISRDGRTQAQYRQAPTEADLVTQMDAYCAFGASSFLAYAWEDAAQAPESGSVESLSNSTRLRSGLKLGGDRCEARYWLAGQGRLTGG